jgi:ABC-2 type transport system ATP-binding protein
MAALEWTRATKRFGRHTALESIELSVPAGATLGLLGPNGAGKTTALRLLLGFARPSEGSVRLAGLDPQEPAARKGVGYLPERVALPARASVRRLLELHGRLCGLVGSGLAREVDEVLERTGVADRARDQIGELSKGLTQRVGFAQALLGRPHILLLDEPTSGLDPLGIRDARDWIVAAKERGCTVLVSSHVLSEVERICDRIAILRAGRIAAHGELDALLQPGETLEDAFLRLVGG